MLVKILKRTAEFTAFNKNEFGGTVAATGHLQIPKKSKVFVEQTVRERDNATGWFFLIKKNVCANIKRIDGILFDFI